MVLITGYQDVAPKVYYELTLDICGGKLITPNREENPSKILSIIRALIQKGLNPKITAGLEYHSRHDGIHRILEELDSKRLEEIVDGTFVYPSKRFPLLHDDIHGIDIGD